MSQLVFNVKNFLLKFNFCIGIFFISFTIGCQDPKPSIETKIVQKASQLDAAVSVQLVDLLKKSTDTANNSRVKTYNPLSLQAYYNLDCKPVFTHNMEFTEAGIQLKKMVDEDCKMYGLFPEAYHKKTLETLYATLCTDSSAKLNAEEWAKAEMLMADAFFQITKHVKNGRLYVDTSFRYLDTNLTNNVLIPNLKSFAKQPSLLDSLLTKQEPKLHDYDSLKAYLKTLLSAPAAAEKTYSTLTYPTKDSVQFVKAFIKRLQEEGFAKAYTTTIDSANLVSVIKEYQAAQGLAATGIFSKDMIAGMNTNADTKIMKIALALDKFKNLKIANKGEYVIVNIPAFTLRGYTKNGVQVESKVAVGKLATKTPIMESEISDIIVMPKWFVPPSILKIPGYIERHRNNPNYIVRGKTVVQKSGPGNALGNMKFNFKSGDAIYLHDTNEKWAFNSSSRAVSHGCVRVQDYSKLASFISSITPVTEKNYKKVVSNYKVDSLTGDTTFKYKYVVKDSVIHKEDVIPGMVSRKAHHELVLENKVPIYIKYHTCAIRNGVFVMYNDVYGYDKALQQKYFSNYL
jgi:L,D-transpeptidase YcbB